MIDIKTLEVLAARMKADAMSGMGLNRSAVMNIADIIERAIGAPLSWPSRVAGVHYADEFYSGSPSQRLAFNHGVKWAVEHYAPTEEASNRHG